MSNRVESHKELKAELLRAADQFALGETNAPLRKALDTLRPGLKFAVVFNWIPEQGEDIFWLLGDKEEVLLIELPREESGSGGIVLDAVDINIFKKKKLTVETRRRLDAALELLDERNDSKRLIRF